MNERQFASTAEVVWRVLRPWLELHFGQKCDEYEFGCECCERWKLAETLLEFDRIGTPENIEQEIRTLQTCIEWRKALLNAMQPTGGAK